MTENQVTSTEAQIQKNAKPAGFWLRVWANTIDTALVSILMYVVGGAVIAFFIGFAVTSLGAHTPTNDANDPMRMIYGIIIIGAMAFFTVGIGALYYPLCESSKKQATPGKRAFKLKVTDSQGQRLSFKHAFMRNLCKNLWLVPLIAGIFGVIAVSQMSPDQNPSEAAKNLGYAGFVAILIMIAGYGMTMVTPRKRALHDIIAKTEVVRTGELGFLSAAVRAVGALILFSMVNGSGTPKNSKNGGMATNSHSSSQSVEH